MQKKSAPKLTPRPRREESLSREQIIDAAIALLDSGGESGLTFRALAERLETGAGAIYGHIADKHDLLRAACDAVFSRTVDVRTADTSPKATIRAVALAMFDAMNAHPWIGTTLALNPGQSTMVRILEYVGQQICILGVPDQSRWAMVSALLNYILGVAKQNAMHMEIALKHELDRNNMLDHIAAAWSQLNPDDYPFVRSVATQMQVHDDRVDFLVGVDLLLDGMAAAKDQ